MAFFSFCLLFTKIVVFHRSEHFLTPKKRRCKAVFRFLTALNGFSHLISVFCILYPNSHRKPFYAAASGALFMIGEIGADCFCSPRQGFPGTARRYFLIQSVEYFSFFRQKRNFFRLLYSLYNPACAGRLLTFAFVPFLAAENQVV